MKTACLLLALLFSATVNAQKRTSLSHGMVFGIRPDTSALRDATKIEALMDKKTRITAVIRGRVVKVTRSKGGWFELDAGKGKTIAAHFKDYNVTIPVNLKGHVVIVEGVAQKQFVADDQQHFAGKNQPDAKRSKQLSFEARGMMID
jgi:hypothetical protein